MMKKSKSVSLLVLFILLCFQNTNAQTWTSQNFDVSKGLMSSDISGLFVDSRGFLWVGNGPGISRYDGKRFLHFTNDTVAQPLHKNNSYDIRELSNNTIAYSTSYGYAAILKEAQTQVFAPKDCTLYATNESGEYITGKQKTNSLGQQFFEEGYLNCLSEKKEIPLNTKLKDPVEYVWANVLISNKGNTFKFYSLERGAKTAAVYKCNNNSYAKLTDELSCYIEGVFEDKDNYTWLIPDNIGANKKICKVKNGITEVFALNLSETEIHATGNAYQTTTGKIIISAYEGILVIEKNKTTFYKDELYSLYADDYDLVEALRKEIKEVNGKIINGHRIFNGTIFEIPAKVKELLNSKIRIVDVVPDKEGNIWYATSDGLYRMFLLPYLGPIKILSESEVEAISDSTSGGNEKCSIDTFKVAPYCLTDVKSKTEYIFPDHRQFIYVYQPQTKKISKCYFTNKGSDYINKHCYPLYAINNVLVCQEFSRGLVIYTLNANKDSCSFTLLNHSNGLLSNFVETVLSDSQENVWIMTWDGVQVIKYKDLLDKNYNNFTSFPVSIKHSFSPFIRNNTISFANDNRLFEINTNSFHRNTTPPSVVLEKIMYSENEEKIICNVDEEVEVYYAFRNLQISFVGVCLTDGSKVRYKYMLEGLDKEWHEQSEDRVMYSTLPSGDYTFKLIACNNDGVWTESPQTFSFTVVPPWWKTKWAYMGLACAFFGILFGFNGVRTEQLRRRQKQLEETVTMRTKEVVKQKEEIEHQKHLIEEKHKEITDSINYAERIQRSFLATKELLDVNLGDYFVFFQPKDVVSGDFYWSSKLQNGNIIYATADSTGHGVPGAIMSLLNITSLEKAIENESEPAAILNITRKIIVERLKKDGSAEGGKDGMDCSLIVLDKNKHQLHYAAANNPVWIVRDNKLLEFDPDKMPVGKHDKDNVPFAQHTLDVLKGDIVYTLTDGFPDQFGGPKSKKYMSKKLKELLLSLSGLEMKTQHEKLKEEFGNWKGEQEQVDDVTIIGIKI